MLDVQWVTEQAELSYARILPRLRHSLDVDGQGVPGWEEFERRLEREWPRLFSLLLRLYGEHYDFFYHLEQIVEVAARNWLARPARLKRMDGQREAEPEWYLSETIVGGVLYVDLFCERLANLKEHIPYLKELGLNYLHLMPLFAVPQGNSDGGYAVSSYRAVNPALGNMEELRALSDALRDEGISLVLDFVFNHTSNEHEWALRAQAGERRYQAFYYMFDDRTMPDQYEKHLREIFPEERRGSFTWHEGLRKWIWTTFHSFQWDLNYSNPDVFRAMADEMLFLANTGVEVLRLDAVAFIWKRLGTNCENQPEAHLLIQAFNALARVAAPALLFKSEAIVHPDEVIKYIGPEECQLSYNPLLMALLWEALATRDVALLAHSMRHRWRIPPGCAWVNYLRCHDDIGWTFSDEDARGLGIDPHGHRRFLNDFYTGHFPGSFARGVPFQANPATGDQRISGSLASLAGLEEGLQVADPVKIDLAIRRISLLHSIIASIGGIPLLYLGDEIATLNDYSYALDPARAADSRWIHRPRTDFIRLARRHEPDRIEGRVFHALTRLLRLRGRLPALGGSEMEVIETGNSHLFGYVRRNEGQRLLILANFSEQAQRVEGNLLRIYGGGYHFRNLIDGRDISAVEPFQLGPYDFVWLDSSASGGNEEQG